MISDKQIQASYLPSIPNGNSGVPLARVRPVIAILGIETVGVGGPIQDAPVDDGPPTVRKTVFIKTGDLTYDGVAPTGHWYPD